MHLSLLVPQILHKLFFDPHDLVELHLRLALGKHLDQIDFGLLDLSLRADSVHQADCFVAIDGEF